MVRAEGTLETVFPDQPFTQFCSEAAHVPARVGGYTRGFVLLRNLIVFQKFLAMLHPLGLRGKRIPPLKSSALCDCHP